MRIAFHAPLKSPNHAVPSGDRQMARLLMRALEQAGHEVVLHSEFRSFGPEPRDEAGMAQLRRSAELEAAAVAARWKTEGAPDLWFSYHSYYKAPDLLGPVLSEAFGVPIVTAEASYAGKRDRGPWSQLQALAMQVVRSAVVNLCFTERDAEGLARIVPADRLARLFPFIDIAPFARVRQADDSPRIVTVAMMRPGDKLDSYRLLAAALARIADHPWTLRIVGDGPARADVERLFAAFPAARIEWMGERPGDRVPALLQGAFFAWPGCGEAYGLAYLEAQAAGLAVVAQETAGVPEVVRHGETGLLSRDGDVAAYAAALAALLDDAPRRRAMGLAARCFVLEQRSLEAASVRIGGLLEGIARHGR